MQFISDSGNTIATRTLVAVRSVFKRLAVRLANGPRIALRDINENLDEAISSVF